MSSKKVVPELLCTNIEGTKAFYTYVLGFSISYERPKETFIYLSLEGADFMFEEVTGDGRRWISGKLNRPFGRGVNFQVEVENVAALYARVQKLSPKSVYLALEHKAYVQGKSNVTNTQFIIQDPDGYLLP